MFALTNLPEVVKGALFARYSRTRSRCAGCSWTSSPRTSGATGELSAAGEARAEKLYDRVFVEYGDDSVAQLGGVHLACEQASQLLCKAIEWGRLAAYLEQSTRYMRYDDRPGGRWRATVPPEIEGTRLEQRYPRPRRGVRRLRPDVPADGGVLPRAVPEGPRRHRLRVPLDDHGEDVRHAARAAARRDPLEPRHVRRPARRTSRCCCACPRTRSPRCASTPT